MDAPLTPRQRRIVAGEIVLGVVALVTIVGLALAGVGQAPGYPKIWVLGGLLSLALVGSFVAGLVVLHRGPRPATVVAQHD